MSDTAEPLEDFSGKRAAEPVDRLCGFLVAHRFTRLVYFASVVTGCCFFRSPF